MSGTSDYATKPIIGKWIRQVYPKTVLDVGPGQASFFYLMRGVMDFSVHLTAVEVWEPYISLYNLNEKYQVVINDDVRNLEHFNYDLVILGDVIEHMSEEDALKLWDKISKEAKYAIIALPIIHYPQGEMGGNPYEVHVEEDWSTERVLAKFSHIIDHESYDITGAFLAKFRD
jgi:hypothetical protein